MNWVPFRDRLITSLVTTLLSWLAKSINNALDENDVKHVTKKLNQKRKGNRYEANRDKPFL